MKARFWKRSSRRSGQGRGAEVLKRIMKKYGRPLSVVTDGLCSYPAAMKEIGNADRQEPVVGSTIAPRIRISRFDDENGPCSGFEA